MMDVNPIPQCVMQSTSHVCHIGDVVSQSGLGPRLAESAAHYTNAPRAALHFSFFHLSLLSSQIVSFATQSLP